MALAADVLIDHRLVLRDVALGSPEHQVAAQVNRELSHTLEGECDAPGIRVRSDHDVVFQLPLVAVIDHIDAGINAGVFHPGVVRHVALPSMGVVADEVVALTRLRIESGELRVLVRAHEPHAHDRVWPGWLTGCGALAGRGVFGRRGFVWCRAQAQDNFGGGEEEAVALAAGEEFHPFFALTLVGFEAQRQRAVANR